MSTMYRMAGRYSGLRWFVALWMIPCLLAFVHLLNTGGLRKAASLLISSAVSVWGFFATKRLIPIIARSTEARGLFGYDINKKGTKSGEKKVHLHRSFALNGYGGRVAYGGDSETRESACIPELICTILTSQHRFQSRSVLRLDLFSLYASSSSSNSTTMTQVGCWRSFRMA